MKRLYDLGDPAFSNRTDLVFAREVDLDGVDARVMLRGIEYPEWGNVVFHSEGEMLYDFMVNIVSWLLFSPRVQELFNKLDIKGVQWLPVKIFRKDTHDEIMGYQVCNVVNLVKNIDKEHSRWIYSDDYPGEGMLTIPAFHEADVRDYDIFRLYPRLLPGVYVSERLKKAIKKAGLTGFYFSPRDVY